MDEFPARSVTHHGRPGGALTVYNGSAQVGQTGAPDPREESHVE